MNQVLRPSWDEYFMQIAFTVAQRSTCDRAHVGCVLVRSPPAAIPSSGRGVNSPPPTY